MSVEDKTAQQDMEDQTAQGEEEHTTAQEREQNTTAQRRSAQVDIYPQYSTESLFIPIF
ncbi:unnamed protein product, partial [Adineta steineri]